MTTTPPAPTLTPHTDAAPCPRVEVLITPMPGDADQVTIYRSWLGQRTVVRAASRSEVSGDFLVIDYEVPLGTSVSYTAVTYDVSGTPSAESGSTATTVSVSEVWLQDPLDPTSALSAGLIAPKPVMVIAPSFQPAEYAMSSELAVIVGDRLSLAMGGVRQAGSKMPLTINVDNSNDAIDLQDLIDQAWPLCIRPPATYVPQLRGLTYLAISSYSPEQHTGWTQTLFSLVGDEVRAPGSAIVVNPRTYDDMLAEATTYANELTLYASYIALLRGP